MYYRLVSHKRSEGQENISLWLDLALLNAIDQGRKIGRPESRSGFIRIAIAEYLNRLGIPVPVEKVHAPDPIVKYPNSEESVVAHQMAADQDKDHSQTGPIVWTKGRKARPSEVSYRKTKKRKRPPNKGQDGNQ